jgi:hypothetical protein
MTTHADHKRPSEEYAVRTRTNEHVVCLVCGCDDVVVLVVSLCNAVRAPTDSRMSYCKMLQCCDAPRYGTRT